MEVAKAARPFVVTIDENGNAHPKRITVKRGESVEWTCVDGAFDLEWGPAVPNSLPYVEGKTWGSHGKHHTLKRHDDIKAPKETDGSDPILKYTVKLKINGQLKVVDPDMVMDTN